MFTGCNWKSFFKHNKLDCWKNVESWQEKSIKHLSKSTDNIQITPQFPVNQSQFSRAHKLAVITWEVHIFRCIRHASTLSFASQMTCTAVSSRTAWPSGGRGSPCIMQIKRVRNRRVRHSYVHSSSLTYFNGFVYILHVHRGRRSFRKSGDVHIIIHWDQKSVRWRH